MSQIVNDRDVLLSAAPVRNTNPTQGKALLLAASSTVFKVTNGVSAPAAISLTVSLIGLAGNPVFSVTGATRLIGSTGFTRTLSYADVTADTVEVTATLQADGQTYTATQTIACVTDGKNGAAGLSTAQVFAYKRAATVPADGPGDVVYSFASASIISPAGNDLGNGWSKLIPSGSEPLYARVASASGAGDTDNIAAAEFSAPVLMLKNGIDGGPGKNGINTATVYIYQRTDSPVPPALPTQAVTYTFDPPSVSGLSGGWSTVVPVAGGRYLHVSSGTAASATATDIIAPGEWAAVQLLAKDGINGVAGVSNAQVFAYKRAAAVPADGPGDVVYSFASASIISPAGNDLGNGWSKLIPSGSEPLYARVASASGAGDTDNIAAAEFSAPVLMLKNGIDGGPGKNGINTASVYIYQRTDSPVPPALPTQAVTYTFDPPSVSGLSGGWSTVVPVAGGRYLHVSSGTAASATATDIINPGEWAAVQLLAKDGDSGLPGKPGLSVGSPRAYQWSISGAPAISGASTYTWATGAYNNVPQGWSVTKPAPPTRGATLYEAAVNLVNPNAAETSLIDWSTASISAIGYVGLDGEPGRPGLGGAQGASAVIAYCLIDGYSLNPSPAFALVAGYGLPATGTWGEARAWQWSSPVPAAGQSVFQTNGIFNPATGNTVWSAPYRSTAKFGSLSAQSTNTGDLTVTGTIRSSNGNLVIDQNGRFFLRSSETGTRTVQEGGLTQVFDEYGNLLMRFGVWG